MVLMPQRSAGAAQRPRLLPLQAAPSLGQAVAWVVLTINCSIVPNVPTSGLVYAVECPAGVLAFAGPVLWMLHASPIMPSNTTQGCHMVWL